MATSRKVISKEDWAKKFNGVKLRKGDMNELIMDFLVTEGFVDAAEKFRHESNTERIDLAATSDRMEVKRAVQSGNLEYAIIKLREMNPEILDTNPQLNFHLLQQQMIELIRNKKTEEALKFAKDQLAPIGLKHPGYLDELERTISLLAFEDVINCPVRDLLDVSRHSVIAEEVNTAILSSQSHVKDTKLLTLVKMLYLVQNELKEKVDFPS